MKINLSNLNRKKVLMILAISFASIFMATKVYAALTLDATTITSDGTLTLSPASDVIVNRNLIIGASSSVPGRITFASNPALYGPFVIDNSWLNVAGGNPHAYFGYNIDATTWNLINPADKGLTWGMEADYDDDSDGPANNKMEMYGQYQKSSGFGGPGDNTYSRWIMTQIDKTTNLITGTQLSGGPEFGIDFTINDGTGTDVQQVIGKSKMNIGATVITALEPFQVNSYVALGGANVDATKSLNVGGIFTSVEGAAGLSLSSFFTTTSANTNAYGLLAQPTFNSTTAKLAEPSGIYSKAYTKPQMATSGTVAHDTISGITSRVAIYPGATLGTITNGVGLYLLPITNEATSPTILFNRSKGLQIDNVGTVIGNAGATINSAMGITIAEISGGVVSNYGLQLGGTSVPTGGSFSIYNGSVNKSYFAANVGIGTTSPNTNAILDVSSTTKAFMPPRMTTTERNAIPSPTAGMVIYNTTTNKLNLYTTTWEAVTSS